jgi:endonuclease/exonuclease/phosphatase family metal-dependent hydrolase
MVSIFNGDWTQWDGTIRNSFAGTRLGSIDLEPIEDIPVLCGKIANLVSDIDVKIIGIQEGPPRIEQMDLFISHFLNDDYVAFASNPRWQTNYFLVHNSIKDHVTAVDPYSTEIEYWFRNNVYFQRWESVSLDYREEHEFHRLPLVIDFEPPGKESLRLMNVHTKSKFSKLKSLSQWENREHEPVIDAVLSRQKLSSEIFRLREYIEDFLTESKNKPFVILGDFNDGPFAEVMEKEFFIHNIIDELLGSFRSPDTIFSHSMDEDKLTGSYSTKFRDPFQNNQIAEVLIDHILLSPGIWKQQSDYSLKPGSGKVELTAFENYYEDVITNSKRHLRPSDHIPVSTVIEY